MTYTRTIAIDPNILNKLKKIITIEPKDEDDFHDNYINEDESYVVTAVFDNDIEMDVKCCGVRYDPENISNTMWTEAVLFKNGCEVSSTPPDSTFDGEWLICYEGNEYVTVIKAKTAGQGSAENDKSRNSL